MVFQPFGHKKDIDFGDFGYKKGIFLGKLLFQHYLLTPPGINTLSASSRTKTDIRRMIPFNLKVLPKFDLCLLLAFCSSKVLAVRKKHLIITLIIKRSARKDLDHAIPLI